jgi:TolA-binding protein
MWKSLTFILILLIFTSCVYYNTFYNAQQEFKTAEKNQANSTNNRSAQNDIIPNRAAPPKEPSISVNDRTLYKSAIEKAEKVTKHHSDSKYYDDALWLVGKARFNMTEFVSAKNNFNILIEKNPDSKYADDAYYYIGMSQFWLKNYEEARVAFNNVLDMRKNSYKDAAAFNLAYMDYLEGNFSSSITSFEDMLKSFPKSDSAAPAQFFIAVCYDSLNNFQEALQAYGKIKKYNPSRDLYFDANYAYGSTALRADSIVLGMSIFNKLAKDEKYFDKSSIIRLKLAEGKYRSGNTDEAIEEYLKVTEQFPKTEQSAEAFYCLGIIYQEKIFDLDQAKEYFNKATQEKRDSEFRNLALAKSAQISKLETYRQRLGIDGKVHRIGTPPQPDSASNADSNAVTNTPVNARGDSSAAPGAQGQEGADKLGPAFQAMLAMSGEKDLEGQQPATPGPANQQPESGDSSTTVDSSAADSATVSDDAEIRFLLAELYHHDLNRPDSALSEYLLLAETYPESKYAPKALLASAFIYRDKEDSLNERLMYRKIIEKYPTTSQARFAESQLQDAKIPMEYDVKKLYQQGEDQYFLYNNPLGAMAIFDHIEKAFPETDLAIKSAYAKAWITAQTDRADGDSSAYLAFADIVDKYPESAYAQDAKIRMGLVKKERPAPKKPDQQQTKQPDENQPDSLERARADSLTNALPMAPPVLDSIAFVYPESLLNEGHREKGRVIFKIKLDLFGTVTDYELLGTSGNMTIDSVAVATLRQTTFDMSELQFQNLSLLEGYFRYDIRFEPPRDWEDRYDHADPNDPYYQDRGGQ